MNTATHPTPCHRPAPLKLVGQATSRHGTAEPQVLVHMPKGQGHRQLNAALHRLAACVEEACAPTDRWIVTVDAYGNTSGRVYLELSEGDAAEAERGLQLLMDVVPPPELKATRGRSLFR